MTVSISRDNNDAVLPFTDTGTGIPLHHMDRLFTPLFTTKAQGIGFGLAITRMIVERHNGEITARSGPNKGATFTIQLPLRFDKSKEAVLR